jgi:hypothetical protein
LSKISIPKLRRASLRMEELANLHTKRFADMLDNLPSNEPDKIFQGKSDFQDIAQKHFSSSNYYQKQKKFIDGILKRELFKRNTGNN